MKLMRFPIIIGLGNVTVMQPEKDVAEGIYVDQSVISSWERGTGNPTFLNVYKLCQFFDVTMDELLGIERKKKPITLIITQDVIEKLFEAER